MHCMAIMAVGCKCIRDFVRLGGSDNPCVPPELCQYLLASSSESSEESDEEPLEQFSEESSEESNEEPLEQFSDEYFDEAFEEFLRGDA